MKKEQNARSVTILIGFSRRIEPIGDASGVKALAIQVRGQEFGPPEQAG